MLRTDDMAQKGQRPRRRLHVIVACTPEGGIGQKGALPWDKGTLRLDMQYFRWQTWRQAGGTVQGAEDGMNAVIMGRKTWESIPARFRPLPGRLNMVITRNTAYSGTSEGAQGKGHLVICHSLDQAMSEVEAASERLGTVIRDVYCIGGSTLYAAALASPYCGHVYVTRVVKGSFACDTFFPATFDTPASGHHAKSGHPCHLTCTADQTASVIAALKDDPKAASAWKHCQIQGSGADLCISENDGKVQYKFLVYATHQDNA